MIRGFLKFSKTHLVIGTHGLHWASAPLTRGRWIPVWATSTECQGVVALGGTGVDQ